VISSSAERERETMLNVVFGFWIYIVTIETVAFVVVFQYEQQLVGNLLFNFSKSHRKMRFKFSNYISNQIIEVFTITYVKQLPLTQSA
jgi:hypothetical protein